MSSIGTGVYAKFKIKLKRSAFDAMMTATAVIHNDQNTTKQRGATSLIADYLMSNYIEFWEMYLSAIPTSN